MTPGRQIAALASWGRTCGECVAADNNIGAGQAQCHAAGGRRPSQGAQGLGCWLAERCCWCGVACSVHWNTLVYSAETRLLQERCRDSRFLEAVSGERPFGRGPVSSPWFLGDAPVSSRPSHASAGRRSLRWFAASSRFKCKPWLYFLAQPNFATKFCLYINPKPPSQAHPYAWPRYASAPLAIPASPLDAGRQWVVQAHRLSSVSTRCFLLITSVTPTAANPAAAARAQLGGAPRGCDECPGGARIQGGKPSTKDQH